jgi:hypothetical protein
MGVALELGMQRVPETSWVTSRKYLEHLQEKLRQDGDQRLARALSDYDTLIFALEWILSLLSMVLLVCFVHFAFLRESWDCFAVSLGGMALGFTAWEVFRQVNRYFGKRVYEALPQDLRWCLRVMS